jgi:hypothetical protein
MGIIVQELVVVSNHRASRFDEVRYEEQYQPALGTSNQLIVAFSICHTSIRDCNWLANRPSLILSLASLRLHSPLFLATVRVPYYRRTVQKSYIHTLIAVSALPN